MAIASSNQSISVASLIGSDLEKIWATPRFHPFCHRDFLAPAYLHPGSLLFIGINPSYSEADTAVRYYDAHDGQHSFFTPFKRLAAAVAHPWAHFDLLFHRETDQKAIDTLCAAPHGVDFVWEQLQVSKRLLDAAQPAVLVVCNTKARELLGLDKAGDRNVWLGLDFCWDEALGTYRYHGIPTFFSAMLSGQRALDKGSFKRLEWHIKRALLAR